MNVCVFLQNWKRDWGESQADGTLTSATSSLHPVALTPILQFP